MVRRVRRCASCDQRFIAAAFQTQRCSQCQESTAKNIKENPPADNAYQGDLVAYNDANVEHTTIHSLPFSKRPRTREQADKVKLETNAMVGSDESVYDQNKVAATDANAASEANRAESESDEPGSEGGDDLHCTQIVEIETDFDEDSLSEDEPLAILLYKQSQRLSQTSSTCTTRIEAAGNEDDKIEDTDDILLDELCGQDVKDNDLMTCFICGASLVHIVSGWKGRLNHIKRCSKKHGVTAKDVRFNDDHEIFDELKPKPAAALMNPYKQTTIWHGDASTDLSISDSNTRYAGRMSPAQVIPSKRSLNSVLLAGARQAAKKDQIEAEAPQRKGQRFKKGRRGRWGKQSDYSNRPCPAYKKIPGTDFVCDGFHYASSTLTENYFLTHFHADHYGGLTKTWTAGTIYCSLPTANLVNQQLGIDRKYLHPLPMLTPVVIESQGKAITVTLLDANHCPGAVMFLFEVGRRKILHVGDFRWNQRIMYNQAPLKPFLSGEQRLDELFLDTTYCDPKYALPDQDEAIRATVEYAVQEVERAKQSRSRILMLFGAYTIGKERIYLSVAERLGLKVYVDKRRYRILSALEWTHRRLSMLTTRPEESILWVVPLGHINMKKLPTYQSVRTKGFTRDFDRIVGFRPTGWSLSSKGSGLVKTSTKGAFTVCSVPYSEHSSFPELIECLGSLKPRKIVPTVSVSKSQQQIDLLLKSLRAKQNN